MPYLLPTRTRRVAWLACLLVPVLAGGCDESADATRTASAEASADAPQFIDVATLTQMLERDTPPVLIDARSAEKYAAGHLPGAINLPPNRWRTAKVKVGEGPSRYLFRVGDDYAAGEVDVARYERMLGEAGIDARSDVVVYGNHAGKADGSLPLMVLDMIGHRGGLYFLDGVGTQRWESAGHALETTPRSHPAKNYSATKLATEIWDLPDVLQHLQRDDVVFWDTRSLEEWRGTETRGNARTGIIPGAMTLDYDRFLDVALDGGSDRHTIDADAARQLLVDHRITPDKTVVLYCQTSTRVSLPYLLLRQLGYDRVRVYDASMFEYLNRDDTPIAEYLEAES